MKNLLRFIVFVLMVSFTGCLEEEPDTDVFSIKFGSECGWCAGQEYITVTKSKVEYSRIIPCGEGKGTKNKSRRLSTDEWNSITESFNYSVFLLKDLNDCNVCADGCDEIISITEATNKHEIRYTPSKNLDELEKLREILTDLMKEMAEKN